MSISIDHNEWMLEQKYRPKTVEECILPAEDKKVFRGIVKSGRCPHLILVSRSPGTGKTTVSRALGNDLDAEVLFVNGADCKIDFIRNEMTRFASSKTMKKGGKIIIIDEFDRKGLADAQRHMRSFMEAYSSNCSIIITANNADGIIEPLKSRSRVIEFGNATDEDRVSMMKEMISRCREILTMENIPFDLKVVATLVKRNFPDFRSTLSALDGYSKKGEIDTGILAQIEKASDINAMIEAMKTKDFKTIRGLVCRYTHDYPTFITKLYESMYTQVHPQCIPNMILYIGDNQKYYQQVANLEIHISALIVQLMLEMNWK